MNNKKGFVLIETIIVMSVLLIGMTLLYSNYNKIIINSGKISYYDNVEDIYTAYYAYKYSNNFNNVNNNDMQTINVSMMDNSNVKNLFNNLNIVKVYYFSRTGFENIFKASDKKCAEDKNQLICYDGSTINYLRSIKNKTDIDKCNDEPCLTIVKLNRNGHYYFAKYEAYDNNQIKIDDTPSSPKIYEFDYTGKTQILKVEYSGNYKIEVWGAQGGYGSSEENSPGGYGGYSVGTVSLNKGDNIFVVVGGKGANGNKSSTIATGGYNGGGTGYGAYVSGGGGATHIAKQSGLLNSFEGNLSNLLIVAAGGGGGAYKDKNQYGLGGSGGGYIGTSAIKVTIDKGVISNTTVSDGGSQNSSGSIGDYFGSAGLGASYDPTKKNACSGGGGGLYGGNAGQAAAGGSGGSSFIGNDLLTNKAMYCYNCTESDEVKTKTITTTCHNATPTSNCAKEGNGYAIITYIK